LSKEPGTVQKKAIKGPAPCLAQKRKEKKENSWKSIFPLPQPRAGD
jgi:hypothetical protein